MVSAVDLEKYEALLTAYRTGSLTMAAKELGYTQSGLTHMMNALEREVGFPLLTRGHAGVDLTPAGKRLLPRIEALMESGNALEQEIRQIRGARDDVIRVGAYSSICMHWLPSILKRFQTEYPGIRVDIRDTGNVQGFFSAVLKGEVDLGFGSYQPEIQCDWLALKEDPLLAILPRDYPADGPTFPMQRFHNNLFLMPFNGFDADISRALKAEGVYPIVQNTQVEDSVVLSMVEHGLGVSILSELVITGMQRDVKVLPLEPAASRQLGIAMRSMKGASASVRKFIACTKQVIRDF